MIDKASREPLYRQIQRSVYEDVQSGVMEPGDRIPSEHDLVARYGVSRTTIRKSLEELVSRGVLVRQPGKGTFVSDNLVKQGFSTMLSFSRTLQRLGYRVDTKILHIEVIPGSRYVCGQLKTPPGSDVLLSRRLRFVNGKPVAIHTTYLENELFKDVRTYDLTRESLLEVMDRSYSNHTVTSKDTVHADLASREECRLFRVDGPLPVHRLEAVTFDHRGKPTSFTRAAYRGDTFVVSFVNTLDHAYSLSIIDEEF